MYPIIINVHGFLGNYFYLIFGEFNSIKKAAFLVRLFIYYHIMTTSPGPPTLAEDVPADPIPVPLL